MAALPACTRRTMGGRRSTTAAVAAAARTSATGRGSVCGHRAPAAPPIRCVVASAAAAAASLANKTAPAPVRGHRSQRSSAPRGSGSPTRPRASRGGGSGGNSSDDDDDGSSGGGGNDRAVLAAGVAAALAAAAAATAWHAPLEDVLYGDFLADALDAAALGGAGGGVTAGDAAGALLWGVALYFVTPWQLLLLFLGKIETERPSDWLMRVVGRGAGLDVDAVGYEAPTWVRAAAAAGCLAGGAATAALLGAALGGDATWAVASGVGALFAAAVYEVGRPERLSGAAAVALEEQWQAFARFADRRLTRSGRCHESEVYRLFRREHPRWRSPDAVPDAALRSMVANWHPAAERTRNGFYKNLGIKPFVDAFTGEEVGTRSSGGGGGSGGARPDAAAAGSGSGSGSGGAVVGATAAVGVEGGADKGGSL